MNVVMARDPGASRTWFNHARLHLSLGDLPPAEFQTLRAQAAPHAVETQTLNGRPLRVPAASEILIS